MITISERLKEKKLKVTPQRLAIYNLLLNTDTHPCAETIYNELKANYPAMSLATVYKTIVSLKAVNLIQEINVGENSYRYDADINFHPHLVCSECSRIYDYAGEVNLQPLAEDIYNNLGFTTESQQLFFYGKCNKCAENM